MTGCGRRGTVRKAEKFLLKLSAGIGLLAAACVGIPRAIRKWLGADCRRVNFAGQQPGAAVIGGKDGPTVIYCSTEYDPDRLQRIGAALAAAAGGFLLLAALLRKMRK